MLSSLFLGETQLWKGHWDTEQQRPEGESLLVKFCCVHCKHPELSWSPRAHFAVSEGKHTLEGQLSQSKAGSGRGEMIQERENRMV